MPRPLKDDIIDGVERYIGDEKSASKRLGIDPLGNFATETKKALVRLLDRIEKLEAKH